MLLVDDLARMKRPAVASEAKTIWLVTMMILISCIFAQVELVRVTDEQPTRDAIVESATTSAMVVTAIETRHALLAQRKPAARAPSIAGLSTMTEAVAKTVAAELKALWPIASPLALCA